MGTHFRLGSLLAGMTKVRMACRGISKGMLLFSATILNEMPT
jgi:hypothetical protein